MRPAFLEKREGHAEDVIIDNDVHACAGDRLSALVLHGYLKGAHHIVRAWLLIPVRGHCEVESAVRISVDHAVNVQCAPPVEGVVSRGARRVQVALKNGLGLKGE